MTVLSSRTALILIAVACAALLAAILISPALSLPRGALRNGRAILPRIAAAFAGGLGLRPLGIPPPLGASGASGVVTPPAAPLLC